MVRTISRTYIMRPNEVAEAVCIALKLWDMPFPSDYMLLNIKTINDDLYVSWEEVIE